MSYKYQKQNWETYDKTLPTRLQEDSIITKKRLDHMEEGIEKNSKSLVIGDLSIGDSPIPSASIDEDEEKQETRLNIVFPKQSQIEDISIREDSTWSSKKIRAEIDIIAENTRYTCEVYSTEGLIFNTPNDAKTLRVKILRTGEDITNICDPSKMSWSRKSSNTDLDDFWNGKGYTGTNIVVSSTDLNECTSVTYYCSYVGTDSQGATVAATGSITVVNMIMEATNTSVSFNVDAPNGTIFDNKNDNTLILEAQAYQGAIDIAKIASFKWFMNGVWIPDESAYRLSYPVVGIPLVAVFTCEMTYEYMTYRNSITIQNRKNVTVSDIAPNDPQMGDIWYDVALDMYKKWTKNGWAVIEDPTKEVTGDILLSISAIKTVQETDYEINTLRSETYEIRDRLTGEVSELRTYTNNSVESARADIRTLSAKIEGVDGITEQISHISQRADGIDIAVQEVNTKIEDTNKKLSTITVDSDLIRLLVKEGSTQSSIQLTPEFVKLLAGNVVISGDSIDLRGYTTINDDGTGGVTITEDGYLIASKGGRIGPWDIGENEISLTTSDGKYIYLGEEGLNFSNKLILTPAGGINTKNFNIDPITNEVTINASTITLRNSNIITVDDSVGIRNLILTSGAYHIGKTHFWSYDDIPWEILVENDEENNIDGNTVDISETYLTFTKLDEITSSNTDGQEGETTPKEYYIRIPLSEPVTSGNFVFNIKVFGTGQTYPALKIYLLTENNDIVRQIGELTSVGNKPINVTFDFELFGTKEYKYIGFKCSEFAINDTFSIVNMSLYKSLVIVKEWQPAPEDASNEYQYLNNALNEVTTDIVTTISEVKGEVSTKVSTVFETDEWKKECESLFTQNKDGVSIETVTKMTEEVAINTKDGIEQQSQRIDEIRRYIDLKDGQITLGNNKDNIKLNMSNNQIQFMDNDARVAYFSTNTMYIKNVQATESLQIGNFKFLSRSNGTMTIVTADSKDPN